MVEDLFVDSTFHVERRMSTVNRFKIPYFNNDNEPLE